MGCVDSKLRGWRRINDDGTVIGLPHCRSQQQQCITSTAPYGTCTTCCPVHGSRRPHTHLVAVTHAPRRHCQHSHYCTYCHRCHHHHHRHHRHCQCNGCCTHTCLCKDIDPAVLAAIAQQQEQQQQQVIQQMQQSGTRTLTAPLAQQQQPMLLLPAPTSDVSTTMVQRALAATAAAPTTATMAANASTTAYNNNNVSATTRTVVPVLQPSQLQQEQQQQSMTQPPLPSPRTATRIRRCYSYRTQPTQPPRRRRHCVAPTRVYEYSGRDAGAAMTDDSSSSNLSNSSSYRSCDVTIDIDRGASCRGSPRQNSDVCSLLYSNNNNSSYAAAADVYDARDALLPQRRARASPSSRSRHCRRRSDGDEVGSNGSAAPRLNTLSPVRSPSVQWRDTLPQQPRQPHTPLPRRSAAAAATIRVVYDDAEDDDGSRGGADTPRAVSWAWWVAQVRSGRVTRDRRSCVRLCNLRSALQRQHTVHSDDDDDNDDDGGSDDGSVSSLRGRVELDLSYTYLDASTAPSAVGRLLASRALRELRYVTVLRLTGNYLGDGGVVALFATLSRAQSAAASFSSPPSFSPLPALRALYLDSMSLDDDDVAVLAALLFAFDAAATTRRSRCGDDVYVAGAMARDVTRRPRAASSPSSSLPFADAASAIAAAATRSRRALFPRLRILCLGDNPAVGDEGLAELLRSLLASHATRHTLHTLDVSRCGLTAAALSRLYEYRNKAMRACRDGATTVVLTRRIVLTGNDVARPLSPTACSRRDAAADVHLVY